MQPIPLTHAELFIEPLALRGGAHRRSVGADFRRSAAVKRARRMTEHALDVHGRSITIAATMAGFMPFCLLNDDGEPSSVFGDSIAEAKNVAWAMTAAAYSDSDSAAQGVVQACEARRRRVKGGDMLDDLIGLGLAEVDVGAFGKKHSAEFNIDALDERNDDRLYKRRIDAEVQCLVLRSGEGRA